VLETLMKPRHRLHAGFTLIELMIVIAIVAVIVALAGPGIGDYVKMQRLRGISDELLTDLALTRSEAVSRGAYTHLRVQSGTGMSCYIIWARADASDTDLCDCTQAAGSRCGAANTEIKTVQVASSQSVSLSTPSGQNVAMIINPRTGGLYVKLIAEASLYDHFGVDAAIDAPRTIRASVVQSGRAKQCAPTGSTIRLQTC
jgi:prepilin-type N-terminal cleavage/methylation domain-containing protein